MAQSAGRRTVSAPAADLESGAQEEEPGHEQVRSTVPVRAEVARRCVPRERDQQGESIAASAVAASAHDAPVDQRVVIRRGRARQPCGAKETRRTPLGRKCDVSRHPRIQRQSGEL